MNKLLNFKTMHKQEALLFLPNAWDVLSALILEQAGFNAVGTTSWGIANAMGYKDGEKIQFNELLALTRKIVSAVQIPVTVDIESGYSESPDVIANNVLKIANTGAAGINIEDSLKSQPGLINKEKQSEILSNIRSTLDSNGYADFFINARTDTYLHQSNPLNETINRSADYIAHGANGIFVPGLHNTHDIQKLVESIEAPLNIMSLPHLTDIGSLNRLGVKRFSIGNALCDATISFIENKAHQLLTQQTTRHLYENGKIKTSFKG